MYELLTERQDLVEIYFKCPRLLYENYKELIYKLNCEGECDQPTFRFNGLVDTIGMPSISDCLAVLTRAQLEFLTEFFNSNSFFSKKLTVDDTLNFISKSPKWKLLR